MRQLADPVSSDEALVTLILPCFNEEEAIEKVVGKALQGFERAGVVGEVLVVDNASTDATAAKARRAGARVIQETAKGYGNALRRGFTEARGQYVIMADGDDTYPVDQIRPFIDSLNKGSDVVYGDRLGGTIDRGAMPWTHRYIGTPLLSWILRLLTRTNVHDSQCGMRAFSKEALERMDLTAPGMDLNAEMLVKAGRAGLRIDQVPITLARRVGESKLQTLPDGWRNLRYLLVSSPDYLFLLPGALLLLLGFVILILQAILPAGIPVGPFHWTPLLAPVIFGSTGAQVLWFGLLAKIYYVRTGAMARSRVVEGFLEVFSLERFLAASLVIILVGAILEALLAAQQFGLFAPKPVLNPAGAFALVLGLQCFFNSFVVCLLLQDKGAIRPS
jgi:hypothetical protein